MIHEVNKKDYDKLITVWEDAVRATHHFLSEAEITILRDLILEKYLDAVELRCFKNDQGKILGFCGVSNKKIEMLFIAPNAQGQGVGSALCRYAIDHYGTTKVDVNEQNPRAKEFYTKIGFKIIGRSDLDSEGRPFPILHMELN